MLDGEAVRVSAGVGGTEGGQPLHVREQIVQVGSWHLHVPLAVKPPMLACGKGTYRAHCTSWFLLEPVNERRQEAHIGSSMSMGGLCDADRDSTDDSACASFLLFDG